MLAGEDAGPQSKENIWQSVIVFKCAKGKCKRKRSLLLTFSWSPLTSSRVLEIPCPAMPPPSPLTLIQQFSGIRLVLVAWNSVTNPSMDSQCQGLKSAPVSWPEDGCDVVHAFHRSLPLGLIIFDSVFVSNFPLLLMLFLFDAGRTIVFCFLF